MNRDENKNKPPTGTVPQGTGTQTDGNQNNGQKNSELDKKSNKIKTVCRYYSAGKCQHGRVGSDCRFSHPNRDLGLLIQRSWVIRDLIWKVWTDKLYI